MPAFICTSANSLRSDGLSTSNRLNRSSQRLADTQVFQEDLTGLCTKQSLKSSFGLPKDWLVGVSGKTDFKGLIPVLDLEYFPKKRGLFWRFDGGGRAAVAGWNVFVCIDVAVFRHYHRRLHLNRPEAVRLNRREVLGANDRIISLTKDNYLSAVGTGYVDGASIIDYILEYREGHEVGDYILLAYSSAILPYQFYNICRCRCTCRIR